MLEQIILWAPRIGTLLLLFIGILGFLKPQAITEATGIKLTNGMAISEARAVFGGMHLGVTACALLIDETVVYACLGAGFISVIFARFYSLFVDKPETKKIIGAIIVDGAIALFFLGSFISLF